MVETNSESRIVEYYTDVVLPALAERLNSAFPEFGWRRDGRGWVATNEEMTHRNLRWATFRRPGVPLSERKPAQPSGGGGI